MGKTNFTFVRTLVALAALSLFGLNQANAQCLPPVSFSASNEGQSTVTLTWTSGQASVVEHCWNVEIGGAGFAVGTGTALVSETICWDDPSLTIVGNTLTYSFDGLMPGTCYDWYVAETCDGIMPPFNNSGWAGDPMAGFCTFDSPFTVGSSASGPTCPEVSPGYVADGFFTVSVTDPTTCPGGTYDITTTPVANSSPLGNTPVVVLPPSYLGVPAGTYFFFFAGAGDYAVTVAEVGICNPINNSVAITVSVPDGIDSDAPQWELFDLLGNVVANNASPNADLGTVTLPEGSCSYQQQLFAFGTDNCDGLLVAANAASASATTTPSTIDPNTQAGVTTDGFGVYQLDINWSTGTSVVTFTGMDAAGNTTDLTLTATVDDNISPSVTIVGINNTTIPSCDDTRTVIATVYVDDGCDQDINAGSVVTNFGTLVFDGGDYFEYEVELSVADDGALLFASYTDAFGNTGLADVAITVEQATEDADPIIIAANENILIPVCDADDFVGYSFQILDDCADINDADISFDDGGSGLAITFLDVQGTQAFVEVTGDVSAGTYFPVIEYQGTVVIPAINVADQQDQAAVITMPGNLGVLLPVCAAEVTQTISITISDDCDDVVDGAAFTLGGASITPSYTASNEGSTYYEFEETLDASNDGDLLIATYVDGAGNTTSVDALMTVTAQPDNWAPIIIYPSQDINVELDACDVSPTIVVFDVTATDNCDGELTPTVAVNGNNVVEIPSQGGSRYALALEAGTYTVVASATDAAGNTRTEDFTITVSQDDRPEDFLGCNDNINVTLNDDCQAVIASDMVLEGDYGCLEESDLSVVVVDSDISNGNIADGCGDFIYEVTYDGLPSAIEGFTGDFAPTNWTLSTSSPVNLSVGFSGNDAIEFASPGDPGVGDQTAMAAITVPAEGDLEFDWFFFTNEFAGSSFFIYEFFGYQIDAAGTVTEIVLAADFNGPGGIDPATGEASGTVSLDVNAGDILVIFMTVDGFAPYGAEATVDNFSFEYTGGSDFNFTTCWGSVHTDDKTDPVVDCPDDTDQATVPVDVQFVAGELTTTDPSMVLVDYPCFLDAGEPQPGLHYYDLHTFTVSATDVYTFDMVTDLANFDGALALFQGDFNADSPCENIIGSADVGFVGGGGNLPFVGFNLANFPVQNVPNVPAGSSAFDPIYRLTLPLQAGATYTLMATSWGTEDTGNYSFAVYSDGSGTISGYPVSQETLVADLICTDIDEILIQTIPNVSEESYVVDRDGNILPGTLSPSLAARLSYTGYPTVSDNCGDVKVVVNDVVVENGDCGDVVITRTFSVADKQNSDCVGTPNTDACSQEITVRKPNTGDVVIPNFTVFLECDEAFDVDDNGNPAASVTGYPFLRTAFGFYDLDQTYCNLGASYSDEPRVVTCESSYKFRREWNIFDWCEPGNLIVSNQIIKVGDFTSPVVECPFIDYNWDGIGDLWTESTGPFDCTASFQVPLPTVSDNCSSWEITSYIVTDVEVDVTNQYGQVIGTDTETIVVAEIAPGASRFVSGIPVGQHRFKYEVEDACGNSTVIECDFQVVDEVEPVAICDDDLNISIGGQGYARVYAEDIDEGSYDNCGPVSIDVRRTGSAWGPHVDFDCSDVNTMVTIELRATDVNGLQNICWLEVLVEDKINPFCIAPHNVDIDCDDIPAIVNGIDYDPFNTAQLQTLFGEPMTDDNCDGSTWEELTPIVQLEDCGFGRIIRRFRATDAFGNVSTNSCQQIVTVNEVHDYEIKFPRDAEANCGQPSPDTIAYNEIACDLLAVSVEDEYFSASDDECYKIFRTFRVINWCEYSGSGDPIVVGRDEDCDSNPGDEDVWVLVRSNEVTYYDRDNNEGNTNPFAFTKSPSCDGLTNPTGYWKDSNQDASIASVGYWQYTQAIKVYDNIEPVVTFEATDPFCSIDNVNCDATVDVPFSVDENCTPEDLTIKVFLDAFGDGVIDADLSNTGVLSGEYPDYNIGGEYPFGSHIFEVQVEDGCGNTNSVLIPFSVVDCKAPTPICINGLAIELMPVEDGVDADGDGDADTGAMAIWAIDFIASPITDCSEPIKYSINRSGDTPVEDQTGIVLTCDDDATTFVEIYAWDSAFNPYAVQPDGTVGGPNYDFCETYILVQDNMFDLCVSGGDIALAGTIATEEDDAIENVEVTLSGTMDQFEITAVDGGYTFTAQSGGDYTVTPLLDLDHSNGVSTFDLVLISRHILGVQPLDSPYKMIAADVDNSEFISVSDLIQLRKLILSITSEFENNTSWRFVDAAYSFPQPTNPWSEEFPEVINVNNLAEGTAINGDFIGVKIGDVSGDVNLSNFASVDDRTVGTFEFNVAEQAVKSGNEFTVDFTAEQVAAITGYQMTLNFDVTALELVDVVYGVATADNFGFRFLDEGSITSSWNGEATADDVLFSLVFRSNADAQLSELLSVSSRYTKAEAYNTNDDQLDVAIAFSGATATAAFELYQNTPNPFKGETVVGFNLPAEMNATITVHDVSGKTLKLIRGDFAKGYNQITLNGNELPAVGVLYYTLETADFTATKKMIIIE